MRAAVLGQPIAHSLSPVLHRAAYLACGLTDWRYDAFEVGEADLAAFLDGLAAGQWAGLSLTRPLKQVALDLVDHVEPLAAAVGAVNTVLVSPGGLVGANTDVSGIVQAIEAATLGTGSTTRWQSEVAVQGGPGATAAPALRPGNSFEVPPVSRQAAILGGGATAASALAAVGQLGVTQPAVYVRSLARSAALIQAAARMGVVPRFHVWPASPVPDHSPATVSPHHPLARAATSHDSVIQPITSSREDWFAADLVISTLPAGAADPLAAALVGRDLTGQVLLDVAYSPWPPLLARAWSAAGGLVASGLDMLLFQAAEQFRLMTGLAAPLAAMRSALEPV